MGKLLDFTPFTVTPVNHSCMLTRLITVLHSLWGLMLYLSFVILYFILACFLHILFSFRVTLLDIVWLCSPVRHPNSTINSITNTEFTNQCQQWQDTTFFHRVCQLLWQFIFIWEGSCLFSFLICINHLAPTSSDSNKQIMQHFEISFFSHLFLFSPPLFNSLSFLS